jgi:D-alanine-D-alanine ligase
MKIVVLAGGLSPERIVSLSSGTMACNAFLKAGHQAILLDLFFGMPELSMDIEQLFAEAMLLPPAPISETEPDLAAIAASRPQGWSDRIGLNVIEICQKADIVYMALHGADGENGSVQKVFDEHGIRYTGSSPEGCRLSMDKNAAKKIFAREGILTPRGKFLRRGEIFSLDELPLPAVAKPNSGGSSIGISIARTREELKKAIEFAFQQEDCILVEEFVKGRELSCGVLDGKALPVIEIIPKEGFYDYKNKYQAGAALEVTPAPLTPSATEKVQRLAEQVFKALKLSVYARMDFLLTDDEQAYCLEANTLPGMTPTSLLPQEAAAIGIDYITLCEKIITLSLEKYR